MAYARDSLLLYGRKTDTVKSGIVYYNPARVLLQHCPAESIKKYWCEMYRESNNHPRQLVLIEMPKHISEGAEVIPLQNVFKVTPKEGLMKGKSAFQIMTSNGKYTLGTDSFEKTDGWIRILNEELFGPPKNNVVYEYRVKVQKNYKGDLSYGNYLLKVYDEEIKIYTPNGMIPTKFKLSMKDIHKVKYHAIGRQECTTCVTISIKNSQTNNKEVDILILNTENPSDMAKVIKHRMKHSGSLLEGKLDAKTATATYNEGPYVHTEQLQACFDELKQKFQETNITSTVSNQVLNNQVLKQEKKACHNEISTKKQLLNSGTDTATNNSDISFLSLDNKEIPILFQSHRSLPRIYNLSTDPSADDQDGKIWSESFELRAPKRQNVVKKKHSSIQAPYESISDRPPAALPKISAEDDPDYAPIGLDAFLERPTDLVYDYVTSKFNTFPVLKNADDILTSMESPSNEGYVIDRVSQPSQPYLQMIPADAEGIFTFMPIAAESLK